MSGRQQDPMTPGDHDLVATIIASPEFTGLCTQLEPFVRHAQHEREMRAAVHHFAEAAKARRWSSEAILKALHKSPCYPEEGVYTAESLTSKRYHQALDFLLYEYFND